MKIPLQWGLLALVTGLLIYVAVTLFERYEEDVDLGWGVNARENRYLAAILYAEQKGIVVESTDSLLKIVDLNTVDVLFTVSSAQFLSEQRLQSVLRWVDQGGHLIVAPQSNTIFTDDGVDNNRLFNYLGLQVESTTFDKRGGSDLEENLRNKKSDKRLTFSEELRKKNAELAQSSKKEDVQDDKKPSLSDTISQKESTVDEAELTQLVFDDVGETLQVRFSPLTALSHPSFYEQVEGDGRGTQPEPFYWASSDYGVHFAQFYKGDGIISVVSDPKVFCSCDNQFALFDHAYLWDVLVDRDTHLSIVTGINMPSFWLLLRVYIPEIFLALALVLMVWVWRQIARFGPIKTLEYTQRRSLAEHINAAAMFQWKTSPHTILLRSLVDDIQLRAGNTLANYSNATEQRQLALLSEHSRLTPQTVAAVLNTEAKYSEDSFTKTVKILQKIRESL